MFSFLFQSVVMLMFREEKSPEDEIKAWQFWHGRQHSVKQRILDAGKCSINIDIKIRIQRLTCSTRLRDYVITSKLR